MPAIPLEVAAPVAALLAEGDQSMLSLDMRLINLPLRRHGSEGAPLDDEEVVYNRVHLGLGLLQPFLHSSGPLPSFGVNIRIASLRAKLGPREEVLRMDLLSRLEERGGRRRSFPTATEPDAGPSAIKRC